MIESWNNCASPDQYPNLLFLKNLYEIKENINHFQY